MVHTTLSRPGLLPALSPQAISWRTLPRGRVEIAVELLNDRPEPTAPGTLVIEAAALGAFVPNTPVARVAVGSLEPGGRRRVTTAVSRSFLPQPGGIMPAMAEALKRTGQVTAQFLDLLQHAAWAGNVNVYFDRQPERAVEVHRALGLRVRAGSPVAVMVDLPPHRSGGYEVRARAADPGWTADLGSLTDAFHFLLVKPPDVRGAVGKVTVEATRLTDRRTVPVDFTFETV